MNCRNLLARYFSKSLRFRANPAHEGARARSDCAVTQQHTPAGAPKQDAVPPLAETEALLHRTGALRTDAAAESLRVGEASPLVSAAAKSVETIFFANHTLLKDLGQVRTLPRLICPQQPHQQNVYDPVECSTEDASTEDRSVECSNGCAEEECRKILKKKKRKPRVKKLKPLEIEKRIKCIKDMCIKREQRKKQEKDDCGKKCAVAQPPFAQAEAHETPPANLYECGAVECAGPCKPPGPPKKKKKKEKFEWDYPPKPCPKPECEDPCKCEHDDLCDRDPCELKRMEDERKRKAEKQREKDRCNVDDGCYNPCEKREKPEKKKKRGGWKKPDCGGGCPRKCGASSVRCAKKDGDCPKDPCDDTCKEPCDWPDKNKPKEKCRKPPCKKKEKPRWQKPWCKKKVKIEKEKGRCEEQDCSSAVLHAPQSLFAWIFPQTCNNKEEGDCGKDPCKPPEKKEECYNPCKKKEEKDDKKGGCGKKCKLQPLRPETNESVFFSWILPQTCNNKEEGDCGKDPCKPPEKKEECYNPCKKKEEKDDKKGGCGKKCKLQPLRPETNESLFFTWTLPQRCNNKEEGDCGKDPCKPKKEECYNPCKKKDDDKKDKDKKGGCKKCDDKEGGCGKDKCEPEKDKCNDPCRNKKAEGESKEEKKEEQKKGPCVKQCTSLVIRELVEETLRLRNGRCPTKDECEGDPPKPKRGKKKKKNKSVGGLDDDCPKKNTCKEDNWEYPKLTPEKPEPDTGDFKCPLPPVDECDR